MSKDITETLTKDVHTLEMELDTVSIERDTLQAQLAKANEQIAVYQECLRNTLKGMSNYAMAYGFLSGVIMQLIWEADRTNPEKAARLRLIEIEAGKKAHHDTSTTGDHRAQSRSES